MALVFRSILDLLPKVSATVRMRPHCVCLAAIPCSYSIYMRLPIHESGLRIEHGSHHRLYTFILPTVEGFGL